MGFILSIPLWPCCKLPTIRHSPASHDFELGQQPVPHGTGTLAAVWALESLPLPHEGLDNLSPEAIEALAWSPVRLAQDGAMTSGTERLDRIRARLVSRLV